MSQEALKPRAVPFLKTFFDSAAIGTELYAAPVIDPVSAVLAQAKRYSFMNMKPKIEHAYRNEKGDTLFTFDVSNWYLLPQGKSDAYKLGYSFKHELTGEKLGELKTDKNETAIKGVFEKKGGFDIPEIKILQSLTDEEKAALLVSVLNRQISFVGIPDVRDIEQALQKENGDFLIVSCNRADYAYETLRMFTGPSLDKLKEIPITNVTRYKDGGTTYYYTAEGTLFCPIRSEKQKPVQWLPVEGDNSPTQDLKRLDKAEIAGKVKDLRIVGAPVWTDNKPNGIQPG